MITKEIDVWQPQEFGDKLSQISNKGGTHNLITLHLYHSIMEVKSPDFDPEYSREHLLPLFNQWVLALKENPLPVEKTHPRSPSIGFKFDVNRPPLEPGQRDWLEEPRALTRMTFLLCRNFREAENLNAVIDGAPCWCLLKEQYEPPVAIPLGRSWPVSRAAHDGRYNAKCKRLAEEHRNDEHWAAAPQ